MHKPSVSLTLFVLLASSGCSVVAQQDASVGSVLLTLLLGLMALALMFLLRYALRRWPILQLLGIHNLLRNVPFLNKYLQSGQDVVGSAHTVQKKAVRVERLLKQSTTSQQGASSLNMPRFKWGQMREAARARWQTLRSNKAEATEPAPQPPERFAPPGDSDTNAGGR